MLFIFNDEGWNRPIGVGLERSMAAVDEEGEALIEAGEKKLEGVYGVAAKTAWLA